MSFYRRGVCRECFDMPTPSQSHYISTNNYNMFYLSYTYTHHTHTLQWHKPLSPILYHFSLLYPYLISLLLTFQGDFTTTIMDNLPFNPASNTIYNESYVSQKDKIAYDYLIVSQNVRSLLANGDKLTEFINDVNPTIVAIQECWKSDYRLDEYTLHKHERKDRQGGGIATLSLTTQNFRKSESCINNDIEFIITNNSQFIIINIYRPPSGIIKNFFKALKDILTSHSKAKKQNNIVILGDFNIDLNLDRPTSNELREIMNSFGLIGLIKEITRPNESINGGSLIDNIFTNFIGNCKTGIFTTSISDHLGPFFCPQISKLKVALETKTFLDTGNKNMDNFRDLLGKRDWKYLESLCPEAAFSDFDNIFNEYLLSSCELKTITINKNKKSKKPNLPWITSGIATSCRTKHKMFKKYVKSKTKKDEYKEKYKNYNRLLNTLIRKSRKQYWTIFYENNLQNSRILWNATKTFMGKENVKEALPDHFLQNDRKITDKCEIADGFNEFFSTIGENLAKKIPEDLSSFKDFLPNLDITEKFEFGEISKERIEYIIDNLKNKKSSSFDHVSNWILKKQKGN